MKLLHIAKLGHIPSRIPNIDLGTSLELVAVLDMCLIPGIEQLTEMIVGRFLSHSTAVQIYSTCIEAGDVKHFHTLRYETVRYMLTTNIAHQETEKMFHSLLNYSYKEHVIADITDIFQDRLNNG
jgi:hypothetical protein